jgi:long-chain acyl-CoA synthetase
VAIIVPNFDVLKADPKTKGLAQGAPEEAIRNPALKDYLTRDIIAHLRKAYGGYEVPQKFLFIAEDLTLDNGLVTQTMKLKRANVLKKYGEQIQNLYNA